MIMTTSLDTIEKRKERGQALVESVLLIPVLAVIIFAIVWFSRLVITRQQLLSAARYGTDLILYTDLTEDGVRREVRNFLAHRWIRGRKLDRNVLSDDMITVHIDSFELPEFGLVDYYFPLAFAARLEQPLRKLSNPLDYTSYVEISYRIKTPGILAAFGRRSVTIAARSEVIAGTGCPGKYHRSSDED
jgi:hypothetical protein